MQRPSRGMSEEVALLGLVLIALSIIIVGATTRSVLAALLAGMGGCVLIFVAAGVAELYAARQERQSPHDAHGRHVPSEALDTPIDRELTPPETAPTSVSRLCHDTVDPDGKISLTYGGGLKHLGVGRRFAGTRVRMLINGPDIRVLSVAGQHLGDYTINLDRKYQVRNKT